MCAQTFLGMSMVGLMWTCIGVPVANADDENDSTSLAKARLEVAVKGYSVAETVQQMWMWSQRIRESELSLCRSTDDRIAVLENELQRTKKLEKMVTDGHKQGTFTTGELLEGKFYRIDTQCKLAQEKAKKARGTK